MEAKKVILCPGMVTTTMLAILPVTWVALFARLLTVLGSGAAGGMWGFLVFLLSTQVRKIFNHPHKKEGV